MARTRNPRKSTPLPSRDELLAFIEESTAPVGKREIARAFNLHGNDRVLLKEILREIERDGLVERSRGHRLSPTSRLPAVSVVEITGLDGDGEPLARPVGWRGDGAPPRVIMLPEKRGRSGLMIGDRVLARLTKLGNDRYEGRTIRRLPRDTGRVLGVYRVTGDQGRVQPTDRRVKIEFVIAKADAMGAKPGELVLAEALPGRRLGLPEGKIVERLGASLDDPRAIGLIALHSRDIPIEFPADALAEAAAARPVEAPDGRDDIRDIPLVTIDGADARDFDDAVWAQPDPARQGAWHAIVAIADVAHYVRPGGALDRAAFARGNSVYLPDRVVPMLPEELSNTLCSLKPGAPRPCLAMHLWIDRTGSLSRHRLVRGLMRSAARLTYEQVQAARDGHPDEATAPLVETVIAPLYGVFEALLRARARRGTIDLDLPERRIVLDADGHVAEIKPRTRLMSHRLIEELMIAANVAAAETLEALRAPVMYRVHDRPSAEKLVELRGFLASLGHRLTDTHQPNPGHFNDVLRRAENLPHAPAVNLAILRSQSQAAYSPGNIGHFGLGLRRYSHFTSPIRRYADLLVHRAMIGSLALGPDGLPEGAEDRFDAIGEHLSVTERRAAGAERDAVERFTAAYMAERVGGVFAGRIVGVTRFGLFVALDETGAEGIVPRRSLARDVIHDEANQRLISRDHVLRLGDAVEVRLREAEIVTGGLVFELISGGSKPDGKAQRPARRVSRSKGRRGKARR